ncbi:MAG: hypothetical protein O3C67_12735 [Cyanobacteria bacterium]|nr:hypothetical protein [Cyanobacteriota bacterium]MEB3266928.1 hypothetical protein [Leptolyngbya sp.]
MTGIQTAAPVQSADCIPNGALTVLVEWLVNGALKDTEPFPGRMMGLGQFRGAIAQG